MFDYEFAYKYAGKYLTLDIKKLASEELLHMTKLALNMSHYSFGVSQKHGEVSSAMFPNNTIHAITNGIHDRTWASSNMQDLYNKYLPGWNEDPSKLKDAPAKIPNDEMWGAHQEAKKVLINFVNHHLTSVTADEKNPGIDELFDINTFTIALARRPVAYKRPLLIYHDFNRLVRMAAGRVQIIQSGKSHPDDMVSQNFVKQILDYSKKLKGIVRIVYLENYSPKIARLLVSGADVWLNTPRRPLEASGTSGMKASVNGVLNFSVQDGWWIEGYHMNPQAGWTIGPMDHNQTPENNDTVDANDMYLKLEHEILPMYYERREEWINRMKEAVTLGDYFSTNRCMKEYMEKAYKVE